MSPELVLFWGEREKLSFSWVEGKWNLPTELTEAEVAWRMREVHTIELIAEDGPLLRVPCIPSPNSLFSTYPYGQANLESEAEFTGFTFALFVRTFARQSERGPMMVFRPTIISKKNLENPDPIFQCSWISPEADDLGIEKISLNEKKLKKKFHDAFNRIEKTRLQKPVESALLGRLGGFQSSVPGKFQLQLDPDTSELVIKHFCVLDHQVSAQKLAGFDNRIPEYFQFDGNIVIKQRASQDSWVLEIENVDPVVLPLRQLGERHFSPIITSAKILDGERSLSALPSQFKGELKGIIQARWTVPLSPDPGVELRDGRVVSRNFDYKRLLLQAENVRLLPSTGNSSVLGQMELWRDLEGAPAELRLTLTRYSRPLREERCLLFGAILQYRNQEQSFALGELRQRVSLKEGTQEEDLSHFCCWLEPAGHEFIPRVKTELSFQLADVDPSGDVGVPETGVEHDRDWHSITFEQAPRALTESPARFVLKVRESVTRHEPHKVWVNLFFRSLPEEEEERQVVVLQRRPMRVAKVRFRPDQQLATSGQSQEFGTYDHRDGSWRLFPEMGQFTLELPTQGVAEEVIKDKRITEDETSKVLFSPNPRLKLANRFFEQRLGFAPWQLTKLLGRVGDLDPGTPLISGRFELFLGLQANLGGGDLRLCELEASLGRLASSLTKSPETIENRWDGLRLLYSSRLSLMGLRRPGTLELGEAVEQTGESPPLIQYTVRASNKVARADQTSQTAGLIRGGLRHCLPNESVYITLLTLGGVSSDARLESLFLSALGGWGEQSVTFEKEGVRVATHGTMGRTHFVQVEVFGRISVGWNLAKHVTVYERQVAASCQFKDEQSTHLGAAWVRKTTEYVEIIELSGQLSDASQPLLAGPVKALEFSNSDRVIPVTSAWMQPLGDDIGYAIPLWQPGSNHELYLKPHIGIALAAVGGATARVQLEEPHKLHFFRSDKDIREGRYSPKNWRPFPLFDYGDYSQTPPEWGEDPKKISDASFHFRLSPSDRAINLLAGRLENECAAEIQSLVLHRLHPGQPIPESEPIKDLLSCYKSRLEGPLSFLEKAKSYLKDRSKFDNLWSQLIEERLSKLRDLRTMQAGVKLTLQEWCGLWMTLPGLQINPNNWMESCHQLWQPFFEQTQALLEPKRLLLLENVEKIDSSPSGARVDWEILISPTLIELVRDLLRCWLTELQALHLPTSKLYSGLGIPLANLQKQSLLQVLQLCSNLAKLVDYSETAMTDLSTGLKDLNERKGLLISDKFVENAGVKSFLESLKGLFQKTDFQLPYAGWAYAPDSVGSAQALELMLGELDSLDKVPLFSELCEVIRDFWRDTMFPDFGKAVGLAYTNLANEAEVSLSNDAVVMPRLLRLTGQPPEVPNLRFRGLGLPGRLPQLNYYFQDFTEQENLISLPEVRLDPIFSEVDFPDFPNLSPFKLDMPVLSLGREFLPPNLLSLEGAFGGTALKNLLPKIAGLELTDLFPDLNLSKLKLLDGATLPKNIEVRHGLDRSSRRGWLEVKIKFDYPDPTPIFKSEVASLMLERTQFRATSRLETDAQGQRSLKAEGFIRANWKLEIFEQPFIIFKDTALEFNQDGKLRYHLDPTKLEFPGALAFLADLAKKAKAPGKASGLSFQITPQGAYSLLNLPIPSLAAGPFGLSQLNLGVRFGLDFSRGLEISSQFNISRRTEPFTLAICALGGSGWLEVEVGYSTSSKELAYRVSLGLAAAASMAFTFGPVSGGIYAHFGVSVELQSGKVRTSR